MRGLLAVVALSLAAGCDDAPGDALTVFAASSLTETVEAIDGAFEDAHPGVAVTESFAGSQVLRLQIEHGAPADVFLSADRRHVDALVARGLVRDPAVFAHNELVVIVPRGDPDAIRRFDELPRAERLVIGAESVPVGRYAREVLARADAALGDGFAARVRARVVSEESNVRLVRAKVELGEADAALVYRTDAMASDDVRVVEIPDALNVRADYWLGVVAAPGREALARAWIAHLRGPAGRRALEARGFTPAD